MLALTLWHAAGHHSHAFFLASVIPPSAQVLLPADVIDFKAEHLQHLAEASLADTHQAASVSADSGSIRTLGIKYAVEAYPWAPVEL